MRVFPHWVVRFGVIAIVPIPVVAMLLTPDEWGAAHWGAVALALLFVAAGARAVIGGVEATAAEYIVRNPLRTRRIPRLEVAGFTDEAGLWSIRRETRGGANGFVLLWWFDSGAIGPVRRYNARTIEQLRAWHAGVRDRR